MSTQITPMRIPGGKSSSFEKGDEEVLMIAVPAS
jgi:hypothetical protein